MWLRPPRRLRPTRDGVWFLLATLGVGFAAVNTGNNLLFFILGLLLAATIVSGFLSEANLRDLEVRRVLMQGVRAGERGRLKIVVRRNRRVPALALTVRELSADGSSAYVPISTREDPGTGWYEVSCQVRGVLELQEIEVATTWPFGLFRKSRTLQIPGKLLVWPARRPPPLLDTPSRSERGQRPRSQRGDGFDLFGLRPYQDGEDVRRIHWKATARAGRLITRETSAEDAHTTLLEVEAQDSQGYEEALAQTAAAAEQLLADGHHVGVHAADQYVAPLAGPRALTLLLDALARSTYGSTAMVPSVSGVRRMRIGPHGASR